MKKFVKGLSLCLAIATLTACAATTPAPTPAPAAPAPAAPAAPTAETPAPAAEATKEDLVIGCIQDLSGSTSVLGNAVKKGAELAVETLNAAGGIDGQKIKFVSYDVKGDPQEAINAYTRLVDQDKASVVIGPPISNIGLSLVTLSEEKKVPLIGSWVDRRVMLKEDGSANPYMFLMQPSAVQGAEILADYSLNVLNNKKIGLLYDQSNAFAVSNIAPFKAYVEANGGEIVEEQVFKKGDKDFKTQLNKIKKAGAEAMYSPNYTQDCILIVQQAKQVGLDIVTLGGLDYAAPFATLLSDPTAANNIYFANNFSENEPQLKAVFDSYKAKYNEDPLNKSYLGYDSVLIIQEAVKKAGATDGTSIAKGIEQVKDLQGTTGVLTISGENHMPVGLSMVIYKIENGEYNDLGRHVPESHK